MSELKKHSVHQDQTEQSLLEQVPQKHKARFVEMLIDLAEKKQQQTTGKPLPSAISSAMDRPNYDAPSVDEYLASKK